MAGLGFFEQQVLQGGVPPLPRSDYDALARHLAALASPARLYLLHSLRTPQILNEIRVSPTPRKGNTQALLSRQAVTRHLGQLKEVGLVHRVTGDQRGRNDAYVLNHERLFALVDEVRGLAKLRPLGGSAPGATIDRGGEPSAPMPEMPRLLLAYGRDDGVAFALHGPVARWRIGRSPACEVRLDYDPYVSSVHAAVERGQDGFVLRDEGSRNGTWVNWARLPKLGSKALRPGDLVTVGRSLLVLQE